MTSGGIPALVMEVSWFSTSSNGIPMLFTWTLFWFSNACNALSIFARVAVSAEAQFAKLRLLLVNPASVVHDCKILSILISDTPAISARCINIRRWTFRGENRGVRFLSSVIDVLSYPVWLTGGVGIRCGRDRVQPYHTRRPFPINQPANTDVATQQY